MKTPLTPEIVRSAAALIDLPLAEDEIGPVQERLQLLLDASEQFSHLIENTAELDMRFNAEWAQETT